MIRTFESSNNGVELTAARLSVFGWLYRMATSLIVSAAVAHPERSPTTSA
jgi:hypothetical protein